MIGKVIDFKNPVDDMAFEIPQDEEFFEAARRRI